MSLTVGVLALQGAFIEHLNLLQKAAAYLAEQQQLDARSFTRSNELPTFTFVEVRNKNQLSSCDGLIIPGGESTTISLVAVQSDLLEPLRDFVKVDRKPTWGTCAGLILLAEAANSTKKGGQELVGGLDVRVNRNHFGRQIESFQTDLSLPFLSQLGSGDLNPYPGIFIRAPIVEKILPNINGVQQHELEKPESVVAPSKQAKDERARSAMAGEVEVLGVLPGRLRRAAEKGAEIDAQDDAGDIIAVKQGNVFGTSFHPELTNDIRIHVWWLQQVVRASQY